MTSASPAKDLLAWYDRHRRDLPWRAHAGTRQDPYRVWLSEIMLQQTTVATVRERYLAFLERWPDIHSLAGAPLETVLAEWAGLGYYARARNLHACAVAVATQYDGALPATPDALSALPGIGAYTSGAIAAIAFDFPIVPVDGNVERVAARYFNIDTPLPAARAAIATAAQGFLDPARPGDVAQALMDLGATVCRPRQPDCLVCPLRDGCAARKAGRQEELPVKVAKKPRPERRGRVYCIFSREGDVLLRRRPPKGLLGGMSELPGSAWDEGAMPKFEAPLDARWQQLPGSVRHVFTHFGLELTVHRAHMQRINPPEGWWWQPLSRIGEAGLPTVMVKALDHARKVYS
ncbi:MAG: A/G-specific adenine glycosylase [Rhodobiaceae bacterium]|nr:A/G-specific adenine glycosylase [Rhodobiaceae bacterium]MCC0054820.1 A/G-specific adenine glycosylase [Rhodobiaceae bacterium]